MARKDTLIAKLNKAFGMEGSGFRSAGGRSEIRQRATITSSSASADGTTMTGSIDLKLYKQPTRSRKPRAQPNIGPESSEIGFGGHS